MTSPKSTASYRQRESTAVNCLSLNRLAFNSGCVLTHGRHKIDRATVSSAVQKPEANFIPLIAVMNSPFWNTCAIILVWHDYGGFYDHVPPVQPDKYGFGFRVPAMVNSLYLTSPLKLIETKFNLPALTDRDGLANDMLDCSSRTIPSSTSATWSRLSAKVVGRNYENGAGQPSYFLHCGLHSMRTHCLIGAGQDLLARWVPGIALIAFECLHTHCLSIRQNRL
jgi:hypothetical protein